MKGNGTSQTPTLIGGPSSKKANVKPYNNASEPLPEIEVTADDNEEVNQQPHCNTFAHSESTSKYDNWIQCGKFKGTILSHDGSVTGTQNTNPILNDLEHDAEFEDGGVREKKSNTIGEKMLTMTDADGNITMALQIMLNHRKDETALFRASVFKNVSQRKAAEAAPRQ